MTSVSICRRPEFPLPDDKMNLPAARNAVRNTLNRSPMHASWFLNDPDCLLMRPTTSLTPHELQVSLHASWLIEILFVEFLF